MLMGFHINSADLSFSSVLPLRLSIVGVFTSNSRTFITLAFVSQPLVCLSVDTLDCPCSVSLSLVQMPPSAFPALLPVSPRHLCFQNHQLAWQRQALLMAQTCPQFYFN